MRLDYDTCKRLKECGFPQVYRQEDPCMDFAYCGTSDELHLLHEDNDTQWYIGNDYTHSQMEQEDLENEWIKCPTLEEIVDALRKDGEHIDIHVDSNGHTEVSCTSRSVDAGYVHGNTPLHALAELYIHVHKDYKQLEETSGNGLTKPKNEA